MTPNQFRKIALGMDGAIEASHMNHPDFRANGKIFATIAPGNAQGMVSLTPDQQARFMREYPEMFVPAAGAWGRGGATMVQFAAADQEVVGEAMTLAWQAAMAAKPTRAKRKR
jgi:YjbR